MKRIIILNLAFLLGTFCIPTQEKNEEASPVFSQKDDSMKNSLSSPAKEFQTIHPSSISSIKEREIYEASPIPAPEPLEKQMSIGDEIKLLSYSPRRVECPTNNSTYFARAAGISQGELEISKKRRSKVNDALLKFFRKTIGEDNGSIDLEDFVKSKELTIGLSFSGGGYRSFFTGAGQLLGLDDRVDDKSPLSGILQASSYITGTHESNWLIGALIAQGFPIVSELFASPDMFNFNNGLIAPYGDNISKNQQYWDEIIESLHDKKENKFPISAIDILARALSFQLLGEKKYSERRRFTLSDVAKLDAFKEGEMPYPLLTARFTYFDSNSGHSGQLPLEMTPHYITSWDKSFNSSVNTDYFGSLLMSNSKIHCFDRFDNLGFLMGASSARSTSFVTDLYLPSQNNNEMPVINGSLFEMQSKDNFDYLLHYHNPMSISNYYTRLTTEMHTGFINYQDSLTLESFVQPEREVDVIFLFDNTEDDFTKVPSFYALEKEMDYLKSLEMDQPVKSFWDWYKPGDTKVPSVPGFFPCDTARTPLIIYIPNGIYAENLTMPGNNQTMFTDEEVQSLINNGRLGVSLDNGEQKNDDWSTCVACAMINHNLLKHKTESSISTSTLPKKCEKCLEKYCIVKMPEIIKEDPIDVVDDVPNFDNWEIESETDNLEEEPLSEVPEKESPINKSENESEKKSEKESSINESENKPSQGIWNSIKCTFMSC